MRFSFLIILAVGLTATVSGQEIKTSVGDTSVQKSKIVIENNKDLNIRTCPDAELFRDEKEGLEPDRIEDITKKIDRLENLIAGFYKLPVGKDVIEQRIIPEIDEGMLRNAKNYPLNEAKSNLFGKEMYIWVNNYSDEYFAVIKFLTKKINQLNENCD
ncbi:MAG: hypothetical protein ABIJ16_02590 [Bacteroidota bacterium]